MCVLCVVTYKVVNATCLTNHLLSKLESNGKPCFDTCPQPVTDPTNRLSLCYSACMTVAVIGNKTAGINPISRQLMIDTWELAFSADDPAAGGCSDLPDADLGLV